MGVMARRLGTNYVITSDRVAGEASTKQPPKRSAGDSYAVWTGNVWSVEMTEAKTFDSLDNADEYVRANYAQVLAGGLK
jgi:hypothetical protein